jgi:hypothetical protein
LSEGIILGIIHLITSIKTLPVAVALKIAPSSAVLVSVNV